MSIIRWLNYFVNQWSICSCNFSRRADTIENNSTSERKGCWIIYYLEANYGMFWVKSRGLPPFTYITSHKSFVHLYRSVADNVNAWSSEYVHAVWNGIQLKLLLPCNLAFIFVNAWLIFCLQQPKRILSKNLNISSITIDCQILNLFLYLCTGSIVSL